jgi:DNA helicase HerA-like ATPase
VPLRDHHTPTVQRAFEDEIVELLRAGKIVIIDLSQGDPEIQRMYSDRLCTTIFREAMDRFIKNQPANTIQMYFEEAHNLFPKKNESDLTHIYNRIAKEGAKLGLGLVYATQEVSSISANVLKNTQNWFVSHLNNRDELREIAKYYDFEDFEESLRRATDKGFIRMKTYSNAFIVPVQIDRFHAAKG